MIWILLVLAYGIIKGLREVLKKKALERSSVIEVLFLYTFLSFLFVLPDIRHAGGVALPTLAFIAVKSLAIFIAWFCGFEAIDHMPVGLYGILDLARVVFSALLAVIILGESMGPAQIIGYVLVITGLLLLKFRGSRTAKTPVGDSGRLPDSGSAAGSDCLPDAMTAGDSDRVPAKFIIFALLSSLLNSLSGLFDKILMSGAGLTDSQLQFWYMLFLVLYYSAYILIKRPPIHWKASLKNLNIWILAVLFVVADRCLFIANSYPDSRVTVMTLIKQTGVIVTIICGKLIFKEKNTGYKFMCAAVVLSGIVISVLL